MTNKIFSSILMVATLILLSCFVIIFGVLYEYYSGMSWEQLGEQAELVARAVELEGEDYLDGISVSGRRVTWIAADGQVLFDSTTDPAAMENHSGREEFIEAVKTGAGQSSRYSATLTERTIYSARLLADGSVIRVSSAQNTALTMFMGMLRPLCIVLLLAIGLSALLAFSLSKRIVKPLNELDLDKPLENNTYEELTPLLTRIEHQYRQIDRQMRELKSRQDEWDAVTESMNEGIVLLGEKNTIISVNRSAAELLETDASCVGRDILTVCRRLDIQTLLEKAAGGEPAEIQAELAGGEYQLNASPVITDGRVRGAVLLFFDVTDKRRAEQLRREFTANVSHELKTPLHSISGSAEIMKNGLVEPEDMPRFIDRIYTESLRMITLVEDIIRLSKLDEGVEGAPREPVALLSLAEDVAAQLASQAESADVALSVTGSEAEIIGVAPLIRELTFNLCDNAIKYNRPGGSVRMDVSRMGDKVELTVSDTGIGIPHEHQGRIFERFYRVDKSHSKEIGGTGLGLSIVKHVARLHGATVLVSSRPGEGTTFKVSFPKG